MKNTILIAASGWLFAACMLFTAPGYAEETTFAVPNGDFENPNNHGTLGGGLLALPGAGGPALLGDGPWSGRSKGVAGLLTPPRINISSHNSEGRCRISGLAVVNTLGGLVGNSASVWQQLELPAEKWTIYTLQVDVDRGVVLNAGLLSRDGVGAALTVNGNTVASSLTSQAEFLKIELLQGTRYRLTLRYATQDTVPAGKIGVRLFAGEAPSLLQAAVLAAVTFDNIQLTVNRLEA